LPSALARGSESRIYSHKVRMYVRTYVRGGSSSGMSRGMLLHTIGHTAICVSHSLTHLDRCTDDGILWRWSWRSGTMVRRGHRGLDTTNTKQLLYDARAQCLQSMQLYDLSSTHAY